MRTFAVSLIVLYALLALTVQSQTKGTGALGLKPEQIPAECAAVEGYFPVDMQTVILWEKTDLYKSIIPLPVAKSAQSFACQGDKGTAYFFQFANEADCRTAAAFIKPLLWGEPGPTAMHPELVLEAGDVLSVVSFRKTPKVLLAALQSGTAPAPARSNPGATGSMDFPIPGHGSLRFKVPEGWDPHSRQTADPASVYLHFVPQKGDAFDVQVTAFWLDSSKRARETTDSLRATVQRTADELLPHSVEKTATLHDLRGPQSFGFYYALTDSSPGPGEFPNLTQGVFLTGEILSTFTILHRTPVSSEVDQALQAFAQATQTK
jgi:hypothetical protein